MDKTIVLFGIPGSELVGEIAAHLSGNIFPCRVLSMDAPFEGKPVSFAGGTVVWEGVDLMRARAIFAESPAFSWPQRLLPDERFLQKLTDNEWSVFQREAVSLMASVLGAAALERPVINPPEAIHLSISPSIALDRLARGGLAVHPWRVEPAPPEDSPGPALVIDACGRDRWNSPRRPAAGESALVFEPFSEAVATILVVGGAPVAALRWKAAESWAMWHNAGGPADGADRLESSDDFRNCSDAASLASRSAEILGLGFAAVTVRLSARAPSALLCEASPDLASWNRMFAGRVARALADYIATVDRPFSATSK